MFKPRPGIGNRDLGVGIVTESGVACEMAIFLGRRKLTMRQILWFRNLISKSLSERRSRWVGGWRIPRNEPRVAQTVRNCKRRKEGPFSRARVLPPGAWVLPPGGLDSRGRLLNIVPGENCLKLEMLGEKALVK